MTEADEVAASLLPHAPNRPLSRDEAALLTTRFLGTPAEAGRQIHANVAEAVFALSRVAEREGRTNG